MKTQQNLIPSSGFTYSFITVPSIAAAPQQKSVDPNNITLTTKRQQKIHDQNNSWVHRDHNCEPTDRLSYLLARSAYTGSITLDNKTAGRDTWPDGQDPTRGAHPRPDLWTLKRQNQLLTGHHGGGAPSEGWTPSGCCSPPGCGHPPAAYKRRSDAAGLGGCLPCPRSLPWRCQ
jgi:hypothetical protein